MPSSRQFLESGVDFTALSCISKSDVLQGINAAKPVTNIGFVLYTATSTPVPDVTTYPEYKSFLWVPLDTGIVYYYTGSAWQPIVIQIADASIPITKLSPSGVLPLQLIRLKSSGTGFEPVYAADLFGTGSFALNKLSTSGLSTGALLRFDGSVWTTIQGPSSLTTGDVWYVLNSSTISVVSGDTTEGSFLQKGPGNIPRWRYIEYPSNAVKVYHDATALAFPAGTQTNVTFQIKESDTGSNWSSADHWYVVPYDGIYDIRAAILVSNSTGFTAHTELQLYNFNTSTVKTIHVADIPTGIMYTLQLNSLEGFDAGDKIGLRVFPDRALNLVVTSSQVNFFCCSLFNGGLNI